MALKFAKKPCHVYIVRMSVVEWPRMNRKLIKYIVCKFVRVEILAVVVSFPMGNVNFRVGEELAKMVISFVSSRI